MEYCLGLIGKSLKHSFSSEYFRDKFKKEKKESILYHLFELKTVDEFSELIKNNKNIKGLNVTIPYKSEIINYLEEITPQAKEIGAVNTIVFDNKKLIGYNTDYIGFINSIKNPKKYINAAVLGNGGASKAIQYALNQMSIPYKVVNRKPKNNELSYDKFNELISTFDFVINTTPVGTYPNQNEVLPISFEKIQIQSLFYDLTYNPEETIFLQKAKLNGAVTKNGDEMLKIQANESWNLWKKYLKY